MKFPQVFFRKKDIHVVFAHRKCVFLLKGGIFLSEQGVPTTVSNKGQQCFSISTFQSFDQFEKSELPLSTHCHMAFTCCKYQAAENFQPSCEHLPS